MDQSLTLQFTHFLPNGNAIEIVIKKGDIISFNTKKGVKHGPVWEINGAMVRAGYTKSRIWYSAIVGVNHVELDSY